ncbi:hypothetical protein [Lysobacter xanthus]
MNRFVHLLAGATLAIAGLAAAPARAQDAAGDLTGSAGWTPIDPARLESMRGGFQTTSGLQVAFGIERSVAVNGAVVSSTRIDIPDVSRITVEEARQLAALHEGSTLQIGTGTTVTSSGIGNLVIQNATDGQSIASFTSLHVSVNTLELFQNLNLGSTLNNALLVGGAP